MNPLKHDERAGSLRWLWLLAVLSLAAWWTALSQPIEALGYDAATVHLPRSVVFAGALRSGVLYPRWVQFLHVGLGSPLFTFQAPLVYYALALLTGLGLSSMAAWRLLTALGFLTAFAGTYLFVKTLTGERWPALLAAVAFLYAPYVLRNALARGSTETFSMFLYPWVLWGLVWLGRRPGPGRLAAAAGLWALCIAAHVLAPLILAPVALLVALVAAWRYHAWERPVAFVAGILLTAFIWVPILAEQPWVHVSRDFAAGFADPLANPIPLDRLLAAPAVYDVARDNNGSGDSLGLLQVALLLAGIPAAAVAWRTQRRPLAFLLAAATLFGLLLVCLLTGASTPVWRWLEPIAERVQYRSRLMGLQALVAAAVAGLSLALFPRPRQRVAGLLLALALVVSALPSLYVALQHRYAAFGSALDLADVRQMEVATGGLALTSFGEFVPRWREAPFDPALLDARAAQLDPAADPAIDPPAGVRFDALRIRDQAWDLTVTADRPLTLTLALLYYPRWQATIDGRAVAISPQALTGYARVDLPAGQHDLALRYITTRSEGFGLLVSGLAVLLLVLGGLVPRPAESPHAAATIDGLPPDAYRSRPVAPPWWLLVVLSGLLVFKFVFVDPATTWLRCVSTADAVCGMQAAVDVPFAGGPGLRGYAVADAEVARGRELRVSLMWEGEPAADRPVTSFVHVRNSLPGGPLNPRTGSDIWAQTDHVTPGGLLSTQFLPGRLYLDEFRVPLPDDMPPGTYYLEIGLADPGTGEQLDPDAATVHAPLRILWRSLLLPDVVVR